jgi:hypothetical protein
MTHLLPICHIEDSFNKINRSQINTGATSSGQSVTDNWYNENQMMLEFQ